MHVIDRMDGIEGKSHDFARVKVTQSGSINIYQYPIEKLRVQPAGIIVFAAVMATLGESNLT
jgi:hypothetical protein